MAIDFAASSRRRLGRWACLAVAMLCVGLLLALAGAQLQQSYAEEPAATADEDAEASSEVADSLQAIVETFQSFFGASAGESIYGSEMLDPSDSTAQWIAYDFKRLGVEADGKPYVDRMAAFVTEKYATPQLIDSYFSTEWNRPVIVVKGLGGDPTSCGTTPEGKPVNLVADGTYNWVQKSDLGVQGSNGWIYALEALHAAGVEVPEGARYSEEHMITELLSMQEEHGAFTLNGDDIDLDITAMAVCALAPYANDPKAGPALEDAIAFLEAAQGADGRFVFSQGASAEAQAQVIMGLCANGIDPRTDPRFVKQQGNAFDGLLLFQREGGSFVHDDSVDAEMDVLATEQAMRAMIAIYELDNGGDGNPYTADVQLSLPGIAPAGPAWTPGQIIFWIAVGIVAALIVIALLYVRHRMRGRKTA